MNNLFFVILFLLVTNFSAWAGLQIGQKPSKIELKEHLGGRVNGTPWSSEEVKNKVHVVFYVDPDEDKLNEHVINALDEKNYDKSRFQTIAVVNMDATWLPNLAIESKLKSKQEKFPDVVYVKDFKKVLAKEWDLEDNSFSVLCLDKSGNLLFRKDGKLSEEELATFLKTIETNL